jgi:hypothetical protein
MLDFVNELLRVSGRVGVILFISARLIVFAEHLMKPRQNIRLCLRHVRDQKLEDALVREYAALQIGIFDSHDSNSPKDKLARIWARAAIGRPNQAEMVRNYARFNQLYRQLYRLS